MSLEEIYISNRTALAGSRNFKTLTSSRVEEV